MENLKRLRSIFKERNTLVDMDSFIDALGERHVISVVEDMELKRKKDYNGKVDETFFILFKTNARSTMPILMDILKKMEREDIIATLQEYGELFSYE